MLEPWNIKPCAIYYNKVAAATTRAGLRTCKGPNLSWGQTGDLKWGNYTRFPTLRPNEGEMSICHVAQSGDSLALPLHIINVRGVRDRHFYLQGLQPNCLNKLYDLTGFEWWTPFVSSQGFPATGGMWRARWWQPTGRPASGVATGEKVSVPQCPTKLHVRRLKDN